jgi:poly(A) polymerase
MAERQLGVTPPISVALPNEAEKQSNEALRRELREQGTFESPMETQTREEVIESLRGIANKFVQMVAQEVEPANATLIRDARGFVFTYGSYKLGVFGPGSDIDTICVAPKYVTVDHFFKYLPDLLTEMTQPGEIQDMKAVPGAFVPIIKFEYRGISIDLIFSSIKSLKQLPSNKNWSLQDVNLLRGMDDAMVASLNGPRVTDDVLRSVPEETTFKLALRAIKLWAKRRGLYGAIYGFPGGVAWAIAVARVCQLYPKATSSVIVNRFFRIFRQWPWPQPVLLRQMEEFPLGLRTWNPKVSRTPSPPLSAGRWKT